MASAGWNVGGNKYTVVVDMQGSLGDSFGQTQASLVSTLTVSYLEKEIVSDNKYTAVVVDMQGSL